MPEVKMSYGLRDGRLVHVADLTEQEHGAACRCVCPQCRQPVVARWGEVIQRHFSHTASNCNPSLMSLVHRYAQEFIAARKHLKLPGCSEMLVLDIGRRNFEEARAFPPVSGEVKTAALEVTLGSHGLRADVCLKFKDSVEVAVEVCFQHAVGSEKLGKIRSGWIYWVEFDIADLDANCVSAEVLEHAVGEAGRWKWLHRPDIRKATTDFANEAYWSTQDFYPDRLSNTPRVPRNGRPFRKLEEAAAHLPWAEATVRVRKAAGEPVGASWLATLDDYRRLAVCSVITGRSPLLLTGHFFQKFWGPIPLGIETPKWAWQYLAWARVSRLPTPATAVEVSRWLRTALGDPTKSAGAANRSGLTRFDATVFCYFLNLEAQGLLESDRLPNDAARKFWKAPEADNVLTRALELEEAEGW